MAENIDLSTERPLYKEIYVPQMFKVKNDLDVKQYIEGNLWASARGYSCLCNKAPIFGLTSAIEQIFIATRP